MNAMNECYASYIRVSLCMTNCSELREQDSVDWGFVGAVG